MPTTFVFGGTGQLLPSGRFRESSETESKSGVGHMYGCFFHARVTTGKGKHSAAHSCESRANAASGAAGGLRSRSGGPGLQWEDSHRLCEVNQRCSTCLRRLICCARRVLCAQDGGSVSFDQHLCVELLIQSGSRKVPSFPVFAIVTVNTCAVALFRGPRCGNVAADYLRTCRLTQSLKQLVHIFET